MTPVSDKYQTGLFQYVNVVSFYSSDGTQYNRFDRFKSSEHVPR